MNEEREKIRYNPSRCPFCGRRNDPIVLDAEAYYKWANREICIQDAFPKLPKETREIVFTGVCPDCWEKHVKRVKGADEDLILEDTEPNPNETTRDIEMHIMKKMDEYKAWRELQDFKEDYDWDLRDLEERQRDLSALEILEEEERQKEQNEYLDSIWEEEYCSDPVNDSLFGSF